MSRILATMLLIGIATTAQAALITSAPPGGTTTAFTATGITQVADPATVIVNGFEITGNPEAWYGDVSYGMGGNGNWSASVSFPWVALNASMGSVTIGLGGLFSSAGAFINYSTHSFDQAPSITALDASLMVLETYDLSVLAPILTPGGVNDGAFRGISTGSNNIAYLRLSGAFIGAHSITVEAIDAPEPATLAVLALGLVGLGVVRRRRG